jgi:hypothetical protein
MDSGSVAAGIVEPDPIFKPEPDLTAFRLGTNLEAFSGDGIVYQAGAFRSEADAQAVLEVWRAEGRTEPMAVNGVPRFGSVQSWQANR